MCYLPNDRIEAIIPRLEKIDSCVATPKVFAKQICAVSLQEMALVYFSILERHLRLKRAFKTLSATPRLGQSRLITRVSLSSNKIMCKPSFPDYVCGYGVVGMLSWFKHIK